ncbi:MAG: type IV secretory system conjugative DNA transfer family protein, partial [Nostoc sp.]
MKVTTNGEVNPNQFIPPGLDSALISPAGLGLLACGAVIVVAKYIDALVGKSKLATARWGRTRE